MAALTRRLWLAWMATLPLRGSVFAWRWHLLAQRYCTRGPVLLLFVKGEIWKLTEQERLLVDRIAQDLNVK